MVTQNSQKNSQNQEKQLDLEAEIVKKEEDKTTLKEEFDAKESEFSLTDNIVRQLEVDIKGKEKDMENRLLEIEYVKEEAHRLETECAAYKENEAGIKEQIENSKRNRNAFRKSISKEMNCKMKIQEWKRNRKSKSNQRGV
jgi:chromosome segregation ATPase